MGKVKRYAMVTYADGRPTMLESHKGKWIHARDYTHLEGVWEQAEIRANVYWEIGVAALGEEEFRRRVDERFLKIETGEV